MECSRQEDIDAWYRSIFLNLDCVDMCRQLAILYVRSSENTRLMAKAWIEFCEKCAQEVSQFNSERCRQVYAMCQQTIVSCIGLLEMAYQTRVEACSPMVAQASLFYGIDLRERIDN